MLQILKKHGSKKPILALNDIVCTLAASYAALSFTIPNFTSHALDEVFIEKILIFLAGAILILPLFRYYQLYKHKYFLKVGEHTLLILKGLLIDNIIMILLIFIVKTQETLHESRTQVLLYFVISFSLLFITRIFIFRNLFRTKYENQNLNKFLARRALAVGAGGLGKFFSEGLRFKEHYHIELVGFIDDNPELKNKSVKGFPDR